MALGKEYKPYNNLDYLQQLFKANPQVFDYLPNLGKKVEFTRHSEFSWSGLRIDGKRGLWLTEQKQQVFIIVDLLAKPKEKNPNRVLETSPFIRKGQRKRTRFIPDIGKFGALVFHVENKEELDAHMIYFIGLRKIEEAKHLEDGNLAEYYMQSKRVIKATLSGNLSEFMND